MATTISTYLYNDDLNGSRVVSMDDCMCILYDIKRDDSEFFEQFNEELQKPALYILVNRNKQKAYIGETDDFNKRINQHFARKDFWDEVLVFLGVNDTISKTEVLYLEYCAYKKAEEVKSYDLSENTQSPKQPHMSVMQRGKADKFFKYVQFLAKFVGCDIFEKRKSVVLTTTLKAFQPKVTPIAIEFSSDDLKGRICMSLNGKGKYSKRQMALEIVRKFMQEFPETTLGELKATFKRDFLGNFAKNEFIQEDLEYAKNWKEFGEEHCHYFLNDVLKSGDGVDFVVCVEWDKNNIIKVLGIAKALGWTFDVIR